VRSSSARGGSVHWQELAIWWRGGSFLRDVSHLQGAPGDQSKRRRSNGLELEALKNPLVVSSLDE
jgi:hypothetical protein